MNQQRYEEIYQLLRDIKVPGYTFRPVVLVHSGENIVFFIRVEYDEPDVLTGVHETQYGRRWYIDSKADDMAVIQTCFKAYLTSLEHRAREHFTYKGLAILHPHHTLEELVACAQPRDHNDIPVPFTETEEPTHRTNNPAV